MGGLLNNRNLCVPEVITNYHHLFTVTHQSPNSITPVPKKIRPYPPYLQYKKNIHNSPQQYHHIYPKKLDPTPLIYISQKYIQQIIQKKPYPHLPPSTPYITCIYHSSIRFLWCVYVCVYARMHSQWEIHV